MATTTTIQRRVLRPITTARPGTSATPHASDGAARRAPRVALTTEGTYPFHEGGVSTWCDQLLHGMPDVDFDVYGVVATGDEQPAMQLPPNVRALHRIALWGDRPDRRRRARRTTKDAVRALVAAVADDDAGDTLLDTFRVLHTAGRGEVASALANDDMVERTTAALAAMRPAGRPEGTTVAPSLTDAVRVLGLLDHVLRPLHVHATPVDVVHASSNGLAALAALGISWQHQVPLVLTEHGIYLRERYIEHHPYSMPAAQRAFLLHFYKHLTRAVYRSATSIAPGSEYNRRWELANGAQLSQIVPIHNGVDADQFARDEPEPEIPTVVWVGRIDPLKDLKTMIAAFAHVLRDVPSARLRIFGGVPRGNDWYQRECVELRDRLGLETAVTFEGRAPEVVDAYLAGSIVVSTSVSEGFPYSVIEAMASARAMVATDVGGVREAVMGNGILVAPQDRDALAMACVELLSDPARRRAMALAGRDRVRTQFRMSTCVDRHRDLYLDVIGAHATKGRP